MGNVSRLEFVTLRFIFPCPLRLACPLLCVFICATQARAATEYTTAFTRVVETGTTMPGHNESFNVIQGVALQGETVAFWGHSDSFFSGLYRQSGDGPLERIVDESFIIGSHEGVPQNFLRFSRPQLDGESVYCPCDGSKTLAFRRNL